MEKYKFNQMTSSEYDHDPLFENKEFRMFGNAACYGSPLLFVTDRYQYVITDPIRMLKNVELKYKISVYLYHHESKSNGLPVTYFFGDISKCKEISEEFTNQAIRLVSQEMIDEWFPKNINEINQKIIQYFLSKQTHYGQEFEWTGNDKNRLFFISPKLDSGAQHQEYNFITAQIFKKGLVSKTKNADNRIWFVVSEEAIELYQNSEKNSTRSNLAFIAIKFKANANATHYIHVKMYDPTEYGLDKTDKLNRPMSQWTIPDGALPKREAFDYISYVTDDGLVGNLSTITYLQGTKKPQITKVNLVDEAMSYDIIENADSTTIRIYSANDKTVYRDRTVKYVYGEPVRTLDMYPDGTFHEYEIAGATEEATHSTAVSIDAIFDNSYSTRWGAAKIGDYAVIDLGKPVEVTHFASAQWEGNTRIFRYQVLASNDGVNFTPVKNVETALGLDGIDGIMQVWEIVPTTARYFKILNTGGNTVTDAQNIYEFRLLKKN